MESSKFIDPQLRKRNIMLERDIIPIFIRTWMTVISANKLLNYAYHAISTRIC